MTPPIWTPEELEAVCRCRQRAAQLRELAHLGVPYEQRRDGSIVVWRAAAERAKAGAVAPALDQAQESTFAVDLAAMRARRNRGTQTAA